ncbi:uncharacterized protein LOC111603326 isoform X2 [Drosophila hydei]|uniref:Uncharacterized protein LOC111603326 isoform X2 n=1 Tax=Drosophila hydei TaxID=7224 RepID=A0A6J1MCP2_DROHY|nr:uncharacterized protein LOC111603326 isoform X2 [Drosophila hydei]
MWAHKTVIPFQTAVKLSPRCRAWPTVCWLFIKIYGVFEYMILDRDQSFWIALSCFISLLLIIKWWIRHKKIKKIEEELLIEKEISQLQFEESLGELLLAAKLKSDQSDNLSVKENARENSWEPLLEPSVPLQDASADSGSMTSLSCATQFTKTSKSTTVSIKRNKHSLSKSISSTKKSPKWRI